jgi:hypothetical protein
MTIKLSLGELYLSDGIETLLTTKALHREDLESALRRHAYGDWGDIPPEDKEENELSLENGYRILSAYTDRLGIRFWIITEADRSATTILLPDEY